MSDHKRPMTGNNKPPTELRKIKWECPECHKMNWSHWIYCAFCGFVRKAVGTASIIFLLMSATYAQERQCYPADEVLKGLEGKYHETITGAGTTENGTVIVITAAPDGATWSALAISQQGVACPLTSGTTWRRPKKGDPS